VKRLLAGWAVLAYVFLFAPLLVLIVFSVNASRFTRWEGLSFAWYRQALNNEALLEATLNSLLIATLATLLSTVIGVLCAWALWKRRSPLLSSTLYFALITPEIVSGISLLALFQIIFRFLDLRLGLHTVVLAHTGFCLSYVVFVLLARLRTMDASLEEAAMDLGATPLQAFREATLPALAPGLLSAALLAFTTSLDDYIITSMVAGVDSETLPMQIYAMARRGVNPAVNAISALVVVLLGVIILISERLRRS
jgi:spermidine/putrescine transport system permease protein